MNNIFGGDVNNTVNTRGIYPESGGPSVGIRGSALTPYTSGSYKAATVLNSLAIGGDARAMPATGNVAGADLSQSGDPATDTSGGVMGRPVSWFLIFLVLLVALMWAAQRYGSESEQFHSIKLSVYNVFIIGMAAILGIGFFKMLFGRFPVPGLTPFIQAI
jgi:hypothetical protein